MSVTRVCIRKQATTTREYIAIELTTHDLTFSRDLTSARELKIAKAIAQYNGVELEMYVDASELPTV